MPGPLHEIAVNKETKQATDDDAIIDVDACMATNNNKNDHRSRSSDAVLQHKRPPSSHHNKRRRKKQSYTKSHLNEKLSSFQHCPHHLRIPASSIAALCGLHPYQNLPQLLFDYVYQSSIGQLLLQQDARALGFTLIDGKTHERNTMLHLASMTSDSLKESNETKQLVQQILEVSDGKRTLKSIEEVHSIQSKIATQAMKAQKSGKLSKRQVDALVESSRGHVSTGFGTCHEDEALDVYERQNGCCVRERNEALMEWHFVRSSSSSIMNMKKKVDLDNGEMVGSVTAVPMGKAKRRVLKRWNNEDTAVDTKIEEWGKAKKREGCGTELDPIEIKDDDDEDVVESVDDEDVVEPANDDDINSINENKVENCAGAAASSSSTESKENKPFFRIVGAVDGIRDELYMDSSKPPAPKTTPSVAPPPPANTTPTTSTNNNNSVQFPKNTSHDNTNNQNTGTRNVYNFFDENDDDEEDQWTLRPIIVECKHRMKEAKVPPPLYDQIQTCLYCHMYNVEEADLIQVVRRKKRKPKNKENKETTNKGNRNDDDSNAKRKSGITTTRDDQSDIQITTTRISLNDPIHNHNHHWKATLLPRIASFVDAVYNVRKDDGKRYRLLTLLVQSQQQMVESSGFDDCGGGGGGYAEEEELWKILWEECPWLMHCDTAFGKNIRRF